MKFKKWFGMLLSLMMIVAVGIGISACGLAKISPTEYVTVTWYDGESVIQSNSTHVKGKPIAELEFPSADKLQKEGYTFDNWYAKAVGGAAFDFTKAIEENTNIYGRWTKNGEEPPVHTHTYGEWTITKPTATAAGNATRTCTAEDCDESANATQTVTLPALDTEDAYTVVHTLKPTCTVEGTDTYTLKAETSISFTIAVAATGHDMIETPATPATCEKAGNVKYYTCENEADDVYYADPEGNVKLESIEDPIKQHTFDGAPWQHSTTEHWQVCTQCQKAQSQHEAHDTKNDGACSVCGYKPDDEPPTHTHVYGNWTVKPVPTENTQGTATRTCTAENCIKDGKETQTVTLPALNTQGAYDVETTAAECEKAGSAKYTYKEDETISFTVELPATGHTYSDPEWKWVGNDENGYTAATATFTCSVCGEGTQTENAQITESETQDKCTKSKTYTATVTFKENEYHDTKTVVLEGQHEYGDIIQGRDATCLAEGEKAHYHCNKCDKDFDEDHNDITGQLTIPKTEHQMVEHPATDATCDANGNYLYFTCSNECDNNIYRNREGTEQYENLDATVIKSEGHKYVNVPKQEATCTEEGLEEHWKCENCPKLFDKDTKEEVERSTLKIDPLGHDYKNGEWKITKTPNAEEEGTAEKTCSRANGDEAHEKLTVTLPVLGSDQYQKGEDSATCTVPGTQEYTLKNENGDITFTVTTEATGHIYDGWKHDETHHWHECTKCEEKQLNYEQHTFKEGRCEICNAYETYTLTFDLGYTPATGSVDDIKVTADNPTTHLPGAPERKDYNFKGWLCEADSLTYSAGYEYTAKGNTKFTAQWSPVSEEECPYNFYITGNGAGDLSRSGSYGELKDEFRMTKSMSGNNTVYTYESIKIYKGDNFKIASDADKSAIKPNIWKVGFGFGDLTGGTGKLDFIKNEDTNIGANASGRYKITLTVTKTGAKVSFTIDRLETYQTTTEIDGYYLTGDMTKWVQGPTDYKLEKLTNTSYQGFFNLEAGDIKVVEVSATKISGEVVAYSVTNWYNGTGNIDGDKNYIISVAGWYKVSVTTTASTFSVATATAHTHSYTWQITAPGADTTGTAVGTCNGTGDVPCDKKEVTLTIPSLNALAEKGINGEGNHSCTASYELEYKVTLQDEDETEYEITFTITHQADPHKTDGTWQSDGTHHWHKCETCDTHVDEAAHTFKDHVCSECSYAAKSVTATFALNYSTEETVANIVKYADEEVTSITLPTPKDRVGYEFNGWLLDNAGEAKKGEYAISFGNEDTTLSFTAKWTAITYKVEYKTEKGEETLELPTTPTELKLDGTTKVTLEALTLTGYTFNGWEVNGTLLPNVSGTYTFTLDEESIGRLGSTTITFTAKWTVIEYTIKFDVNTPELAQGSIIGGTADKSGVTIEADNNTIMLPQLSGLTSHEFKGWTLENGSGSPMTGESITLSAEMIVKANDAHEITLYASWTEVGKLNATFDYGVSGIENPATQTVYPNEQITFPEEKDRTGYTFEGWKEDGVEQGQTYEADTTLDLTKDTKFVAVWTAITYTVQFTGEDVSETSKQITLDNAEQNLFPTAKDMTRKGYTFAGWQLNGAGDYTKLTADLIEAAESTTITLTAKWNAKEYNVDFEANGDNVTNMPSTRLVPVTLDSGSNEIELTVPVRTGYTFQGWKLKGYSEETLFNKEGGTFTLTADILGKVTFPEDSIMLTFTAQWKINTYTVTFETAVGDLKHESVSVEYNQPIDLTNQEYVLEDTDTQHFVGWRKSTESSEIIETYTVTEDITFVAVWEDKILVTFEIEGQEDTTVYVVKGEKIPDDAYPQDPTKEGDYRFDNWYKVGEETAYDREATVSEPFTLEARFIKQIHITYFDEYNDALSTKNETIDENTAATKATVENKGYKISTGSTINIWHSEWYLDEARTQKYNNDALETDTKLYRKWVETKGNTKVTVPSGRPTWIAVGDSYNGSPLEWSYKEYTAGKLKLDSSLEYHEVYTITLALFKYSNSDNKSGKFRFKQATTTDDWSNCKGYSDLYSSLATENFSLADDNNMKVKNSGIYKFVIIYQDNTAYLSYEKICSLTSSGDLQTGYYLVGSMTNWADQYANPIYLGAKTASGPFTKDIEITENDYGWKEGGKDRYTHATAKVILATAYSNKYIYVSDWDVTTNLDTTVNKDNNFHFPEGTGTFRVTFTISNSLTHRGSLSVVKDEEYTHTYNLGSCDGTDFAGTPVELTGGSVNSLGDRKVKLPAAPVWGGYRFKGWDVGGTLYEAEQEVTLSKSVTITAQWVKRITITFKGAGEDGGDATVVIDKDTSVGEKDWKQVPAKVGYENGRWVRNGSEECSYGTTFDADTTLTLEYDAINYTVHFESVHGTPPADFTTLTLEDEQNTLDLTKEPYTLTAKGYTFNGWTGDGVSENTFTLTTDLIGKLQGDSTTFTVNAEWAANLYTVVFEHDPELGEGTVSGMPTTNYQVFLDNAEQKIDLQYTELTREGYKFSHWTIQGVANNYHSEQVALTVDMIVESSDKITVTAHWTEASKFSITFSANDGEKGNMPDGDQVEAGEYTIPEGEPTRKGYTFQGWYVDNDEDTLYKYGDDAHGTYEVTTENVEFKAKWEAKNYTISFQDEDHGQTANSITVTLDDQEGKSLPAMQVKGYELKEWDCNGTKIETGTPFLLKEHADIIPEGDTLEITFTAVWEAKEYEIHFAVVDPKTGITADKTVESETLTGVSLENTTIDLPKPLEPKGYTFKAWMLNNVEYMAGVQTFTEAMIPDGGSAIITLTTSWQAISYTVKFSTTYGSLPQKTVSLDSPTISWTNPTQSGYKLTKWTYNGGTFTTSFTLTQARIPASGTIITLTATWEATYDTVTITFNNSVWAGWGDVSSVQIHAWFLNGDNLFNANWPGQEFKNGSKGTTKLGYDWSCESGGTNIYILSIGIPKDTYTSVHIIFTGTQGNSTCRMHEIALTDKTVKIDEGSGSWEKDNTPQSGHKLCSITGSGFRDCNTYE